MTIKSSFDRPWHRGRGLRLASKSPANTVRGVTKSGVDREAAENRCCLIRHPSRSNHGRMVCENTSPNNVALRGWADFLILCIVAAKSANSTCVLQFGDAGAPPTQRFLTSGGSKMSQPKCHTSTRGWRCRRLARALFWGCPFSALEVAVLFSGTMLAQATLAPVSR